MKAFFKAIEDLFVDVLFAPFDLFRFMESWWASNLLNWLFFVIGAVAMTYWMLQLKKYNDNGEEDKEVTAHSYL